MDNLTKILPIRNYRLREPLVLAFNINLNHFNAFGTAHYNRAYNALTNVNGVGLETSKVILLPNITNLTNNIESRG